MDPKALLKEEATELTEKVDKLKTFLNGREFQRISIREQDILRIQYGVMVIYLECLNTRYSIMEEASRSMTEKDY